MEDNEMKASPFLIQKDASGEPLYAIGEGERAYDEAWLQALLRQHPEILPTAEIEPVFQPLVSIGCEVGTETGSIDNLFISPRGYPVLVETKLWRNPEARREVVTQAIDYASSLSKWTYSRLDEAVQAYLKAYEGIELDLLGWVEKHHGPVEGGRHFFEETVAKNLRLGRFLTLIVGDRIRQSVVDMLAYVNRYPHLATDVALVELLCYRWKPEEDWPLLVVPTIVARTEIVERSVVQVTVQPEIPYQIEVHQERAEPEGRGRSRVSLTEEAYWELLREQASDDYQEMRRLIKRFRTVDGVSIDPAETGLVVRFDISGTSVQASVFFAKTTGELGVWPFSTIAKQLERAGLNPDLALQYGEQMRTIMKMPKNRVDFSRSIAELDVAEFTAAAVDFVEEVRRAASER
jgi:hypothetical protein